jgi:hypothetical protein
VVTQTATARATPDVAYNASGSTGVYVYDSVVYSGSSGWWSVGGTSAGAPQWSALLAIADQGRTLSGQAALNSTSPQQVMNVLYEKPADFHDITTGTSTGTPPYSAGPGYDYVTGMGSPIANLLIPDLAPSGQVQLAAIPDQTVAAGQSLTLTLQGSGPAGLTLTYSASEDTLAYHLKSTLGLYTAGNYYTNWGGAGEQWVQGTGGVWYYILPSGAFYQWSGSGLTGTFIAQLDPSYNANPSLLVNAQPGQGQATVSLSGAQLTITPNAGFTGLLYVTATVSDGQGTASQMFQLTVTGLTLAPIPDQTVAAGQSLTLTLQGSDPDGDTLTYSASVDSLAYYFQSTLGLYESSAGFYTNVYGGGEQWVQGSGGVWYYILPSGGFYKWSGVSGQLTGTFVAQLDPNFNTDPALLTDAQDETVAYYFRRTLGLYTNGNYFTNWGGRNEKWIQGTGGVWYFITPDGSLYQWDGSSTASGSLVAQFSPAYNVDPTLLTNAPQYPATLAVSGASLTITPNAGFTGVFYVTATVSDGSASASQAFKVSVTS